MIWPRLLSLGLAEAAEAGNWTLLPAWPGLAPPAAAAAGVAGRSTSILGSESARTSWILGMGLKGGSGDSGAAASVSFSLEFLLTSCDTLSATLSIVKYFLILPAFDYQQLEY